MGHNLGPKLTTTHPQYFLPDIAMGKHEDVDYHPLMSDSSERLDEPETPGPRRSRPSYRRHVLFTIFVAQTFLNVVLIGLYYRRGEAKPAFPKLTYSPAQDVVSFKIQSFFEGFDHEITIYQKEPSDEVDQAWQDLYSFGISEIPRSVAEKLTNKTYPLAGSGGNYIVELDVFHQLHCLNTIRMALSPDYYRQKNMTSLERSFLEPPHARHCLDAIRQSLMCNADISTYVWQWDPKDRQVKPTGNVPHTCKDYDKIVEWAKEHHIRTPFDRSIYVEDDLGIPIIYA